MNFIVVGIHGWLPEQRYLHVVFRWVPVRSSKEVAAYIERACSVGISRGLNQGRKVVSNA